MLTRRHIRIKVMQSLYSYFSTDSKDVSNSEIIMLKHFDAVVELKLAIISLLVELVDYADNFYQDGKNKYFPSPTDLNPNTRLVKNKIISGIKDNKDLMRRISKSSYIWLDNDHDVIRKIFTVIIKSDLYVSYLKSDDTSSECDKKFIIDIMNEVVLNDHLIHHILEEKSIYWIDDLPFIATVIFGEIKDNINMNPRGSFKHSSDKDFALDLFRNTIRNNTDYESIIARFAKNWEIDRIAKMDQIFLKMAFAEILCIQDLPIKVSLNEYIEISKYYSTSKSKSFVNGLLDSFVRTYVQEGKIKKVGKGLV